FMEYATRHYRTPDGKPTSEIYECKIVVKALREFYAETPGCRVRPAGAQSRAPEVGEREAEPDRVQLPRRDGEAHLQVGRLRGTRPGRCLPSRCHGDRPPEGADRSGEKEVRFDWRANPTLLPVWWDGQLRLLRWGNKDRAERKLPPTGWTWKET